jgi:DNA-binding response OmpR family regulator
LSSACARVDPGTLVAQIEEREACTLSLSILVVERERHAREGLKAILSADGHDVKVAEDMWAGFASIFSRPYDLLLLDDNVQTERHVSLNVLDLLRFARRYEPDTRAVVITSFDEHARGYWTEDGVVAVLQKPLELSRLRDQLDPRLH